MDTEPKIPFGYKRVSGQIQKGDGVLDPVTGLYHRVRKEYPRTDDDRIFIRRCKVEQALIPETCDDILIRNSK